MFNIRPEDLVSKTDKILYNIYELLREDLLLHSMRKGTDENIDSLPIEKPIKPKIPQKKSTAKKTTKKSTKSGTRKSIKQKEE
jgi:hypothetical protein